MGKYEELREEDKEELREEDKAELLREFIKHMLDIHDRICENCGEFRMCAAHELSFYCLDCYVAVVYEKEIANHEL